MLFVADNGSWFDTTFTIELFAYFFRNIYIYITYNIGDVLLPTYLSDTFAASDKPNIGRGLGGPGIGAASRRLRVN